MKKIILFIMLILVMGQLAEGRLTHSVKTEKNNVFPGEEAKFILYITNTGDDDERVKYTFPRDPDWSIFPDPVFVEREMSPGEVLVTEITLIPQNKNRVGRLFELEFLVESVISRDSIEDSFKVFVKNPSTITRIAPMINRDYDLDKEVDPRNKATLQITLKNHNILNLTDFTFDIKSMVNPENDQVVVIPLMGNQQVTETIILEYSPTQSPATDTIVIKPRIPSQNLTMETIRRQINITAYSIADPVILANKSAFKTTTSITIFNDGNIPITKEVRERTTFFRKLFTKTDPEYEETTERGYREMVWRFNLAPQETRNISITTNYAPLVITIVLLIVGMLIYLFTRSPLIARKESRTIAGHKGETTRLKILVHIKNRTNKPIEKITLIDSIPRIAELEKNFAVGTLQPAKILRNEKKGTIIRWEISTLEPYEERIITYQVFSKLEIVGPLKLKPALIKYKKGRRIARINSSIATE